MKYYMVFFLMLVLASACTEELKTGEKQFIPDYSSDTTKPTANIVKNELKFTYPSGTSFGLAVLQETWKGYCDGRQNEYLKIARNLNYLSNDIEGLSFPDCVKTIAATKAELNDTMELSAYVNTQEMFSDNSLRVWQQANYDWVVNNAPQFLLLGTNGQPFSVWGGMDMMNQLSNGVSVDGRTYREFINDRIISQLDKAPKLFDSVQYDNFNYIMQWIYKGGGNVPDVDVSSPWDYDRKNRDGLRLMISDMRAKRPDLGITIRSKTHKFSKFVDGVVFENALSSDIDGGIFGTLNQIALIAKYSKHCVVHNTIGTDPSLQDEKIITSVAVSWLFGCDASVDTKGDQDHFYTHFPILANIYPGKPVGDIQGPKVISYEEIVNVEDASCVTVKGKAGDTAVAWYDIIDGQFGMSSMFGVFESVDRDDPSFSWDSGLRITQLKEDNPELCFDGPGRLQLEDLTVYRLNEKSYFYREFENIELFVNPFSDRVVNAISKDGTAVRLNPEQGIIRKIW